MAEINAKIDYKGLKKLIKAMSNQFDVKVGLLKGMGGDEPVSDDMDEAGIGAIQEFGCVQDVTPKQRGWFWYEHGIHVGDKLVIPPRSWLLMPLMKSELLLKNIKRGMAQWQFEEYVSKTGDLESLAVMVGAGAHQTIMQAFDTQGFGEWQPNSEITVKMKGSDKPLHNFGTLKNAIAFKVDRKK